MGWQEQLERTVRFLERIENQEQERNVYEDMMWAFFQNCWHLKDWIKHDEKVDQSVRNSIENDIKKCDSLMVCADLANRSKHSRLDKVIRKHADAKGRTYNVRVGGADHGIDWDYRIDSDDGRERWALEVAREAVKNWKELILDWGLASS